MIDKEILINSLTAKDVIEVVENLGCTDYIEKEHEIIFSTLCHHADPEEGSHKLYYYKKDHRFYCYTCCGAFDIIGLICKRYELLDTEYNFYSDVLLPLAEKANINTINTTSSFTDAYESNTDKYKSKKIEIVMPALDPAILNPFIFYPT